MWLLVFAGFLWVAGVNCTATDKITQHILSDVVALASELEELKQDVAWLRTMRHIEEENGRSGRQLSPRVNNTGPVYTTYNIWGRRHCPTSSEEIYSGVAGGEYYSHTGGASDFQCLPMDPIYARTAPNEQSTRGLMYPVQYMGSWPNNAAYTASVNHDVPCAVCRARRSTHITVPARNVCPSGWTLEYKGFLLAAYQHSSSYDRSQYICVDELFETVPSTGSSVYAAQLFPAEGKCTSGGGLPCSPYIEGYELTCAVCSI
ncbi:short-chain collagen C4-like [Branchiostoma floridae]|uniref:Short-chain collagen C4-like n=2 Tax=Branchiostoma floridae TaxID=7739 RepID=A0A9J7MAL8_BRAFL|nr:short-chain collagen C4-like [Branchiostoma floridae]